MDNPRVLLVILIVGVAVILIATTLILYIITGRTDLDLSFSRKGRGAGKKNVAAKSGGGRSNDDPALALFAEIEYARWPEDLQPLHMGELDSAIHERVAQIVSEYAGLPRTSFRLQQLMQDPESSAKEIADVVATNPMLSAHILRTINSSYFGLPQEVSSIDRALTLLGYNNVRSMIIQDALRGTLPQQKEMQAGARDMWVHSMVVSACAHHLSNVIPGAADLDLATVGLFHDIGRYFLPLMEEQKGYIDGSYPEIIIEERRYGVNHALLGSLVATKWRISKMIAKCVEFHHHPVFAPPESIPPDIQLPSFILCLSNLICRQFGYPGSARDIFPIQDAYFTKFGLSNRVEDIVTEALLNEIEKAKQTVESYAD